MKIIKVKNEFYLQDGTLTEPIEAGELEYFADCNPWFFEECKGEDVDIKTNLPFVFWMLDLVVEVINCDDRLMEQFTCTF